MDDAPTDLIRDGFDLSIRIEPALRASTNSRRIAAVPIVTRAAPAYLDRHGTPSKPANLGGHSALSTPTATDRTSRRSGATASRSCSASADRWRRNGGVLRVLAVAGQVIVLQPAFIVGSAIAAGNLVAILPDFAPLPRAAFAIDRSRRVTALVADKSCTSVRATSRYRYRERFDTGSL